MEFLVRRPSFPLVRLALVLVFYTCLLSVATPELWPPDSWKQNKYSPTVWLCPLFTMVCERTYSKPWQGLKIDPSQEVKCIENPWQCVWSPYLATQRPQTENPIFMPLSNIHTYLCMTVVHMAILSLHTYVVTNKQCLTIYG